MHPLYARTGYPAHVIEIADSAPSTITLPDPVPADPTSRQRKIDRACDACRRRKTKCDGPRMPDNICTNCKQNRKTCSYVEASKPRGPPKAYVTSLEDRLEKMEALLKRLRPEADFSDDLGPPVTRDSWKDPEPTSPHGESSTSRLKGSPSRSLHPTDSTYTGYRSQGSPRSDTDSSSDDDTSSEYEEVGELSLSRGMKRLTMRGLEPTHDSRSSTDNQVRFHGKSSWFKLIEPTRKLREEHVNRLAGGEDRSPSSRDSTSPINAAALRRPEFWTTPPWELALESSQTRFQELSFSLAEDFPPQDLADNLIELFFENINPFVPLFHRPTFERQWREGLQHNDVWFGCLCLSLFAVASRWSDDPRVLVSGQYDHSQAERPTEKHRWQRAGWRFFNAAVDIHRGTHSLFHPPVLFEIQTVALLGMFLRGTAFHPVAWIFVSVALRKSQDVGAHRKKMYGDRPTVEGELWKRVFWVLVLLDRLSSAALGRPCCSGEEEFDVELPLEVDDEYWETEDAEQAFKQPPDTPSKIAAFNSHLKLTKIAAYAMRTIYALDRSKLLVSAARPRWQEVLTQLNQAMNEWADSVPKHLRWSPHIQDALFSDQSATLYITYYLIQIIIYRPFFPSSLSSVMNVPPHSSMAIPSIGICVNAAKCVSRILKAQISRGYTNIPILILGSHMCAAVLLMNFWDMKWQERNQMRSNAYEDIKPPLALAMAELLEHVSLFIEALEAVEPRWRNAEIYLNDLSSSLPHGLRGRETGIPENDPLLLHHLLGVDDGTRHSAVPSGSTLGNLPSEYRIPLPPIDMYSGDTQVGPSQRSPHFFEFSHLTHSSVPSALPIPSPLGLCQRDQPEPLQPATFHSQRGHNRFSMQTGRATDDESTTMPNSSSSNCRQYTANRATRGFVAATQQNVGSFGPNQRTPGRATNWAYNPPYPYGPSF